MVNVPHINFAVKRPRFSKNSRHVSSPPFPKSYSAGPLPDVHPGVRLSSLPEMPFTTSCSTSPEVHPGRRLPSIDLVEDIIVFLESSENNFVWPAPPTLQTPPHPGTLTTLGEDLEFSDQASRSLSTCSCTDFDREGVCWICQEDDFRTDPKVCEQLALYQLQRPDPYPECKFHQGQGQVRENPSLTSPISALLQASEPAKSSLFQELLKNGEWISDYWQRVHDHKLDRNACAQLDRYQITYRTYSYSDLAQSDSLSPKTLDSGEKSLLSFPADMVVPPGKTRRRKSKARRYRW